MAFNIYSYKYYRWIYAFSPTLMFVLSALAIVPLAGLMGEATEEISFYTGPKLGGF